jgi:hypothetical protein
MAEKIGLRDYKKWEQGRKTYLYLQRMGFFNGYEIVGSDDKKECELCDRMQGKYVRLTDITPLPPFHPNCRCKVVPRWKSVANLDEIYRYFYDPETGEIRSHAGYEPTVDVVLDAINYFLEKNYGENKNLAWNEIVALGFVNSEGIDYFGETYDAELLVGQKFAGAKWNIFLEDRLESLRSKYDTETGEIKADATKEKITQNLSDIFGIDLTWEEICRFGFYDEKGKKVDNIKADVDISKLVGYKTRINKNTPVYNPEDGRIGPNATEEDIVRILNEALREKGLEENLSWIEIINTGFYNWLTEKKVSGFGLEPEDLIGYTTLLDSTSVLNVDANFQDGKEYKDTLDYWIWDAIGHGITIDWVTDQFGDNPLSEIISIVFGFKESYEGSTYDLKARNDTVFGQPDGKREYWGYIWHGKFLTYDSPGNIVIGALAGALDIPWNTTAWGADAYAFLEGLAHYELTLDDPEDIANFKIGYDMAKEAKGQN